MAINPAAAYAVTDSSAVHETRRAAQWLADRLHFSEAAAGRLVLVVSELATNLAKHAVNGELVLRPIDDACEPCSIEAVAIDRGPGIPDFALAARDGHSTTGSLGHGLGAIQRQSDEFHVYSQPSGTVIAARVLRDGRRAAARPEAVAMHGAFEVGAIHVSKPGEEICGDAWGWRAGNERLAIVVADGLGHGPQAHDAAVRAVETFQNAREEVPERVIEEVHGALRPTRGAAVAVLSVDLQRQIAQYCGLGNISSLVIRPDGTRQSMVSLNGTAGHTAGRISAFSYALGPKALLVLHTDGLASHWSLDPYPGLRGMHPSVIAAVLYRDFARRRDDVTVVVARERLSP